jgi:hypothetical protein
MLATWIILGIFFGSSAALSAYIITYREYERHKMQRQLLIRHSLSSACIAFLFFFAVAVAIGVAVSHGL